MLCAGIVLQGRVQGVGFRYFVVDIAKSMGLAGEVWNNYDGTIEIEVYCEKKENLDEFCRRVRKGPPLSRVDDLTMRVTPSDPPLENTFRVRQ